MIFDGGKQRRQGEAEHGDGGTTTSGTYCTVQVTGTCTGTVPYQYRSDGGDRAHDVCNMTDEVLTPEKTIDASNVLCMLRILIRIAS